MSKVYSSLRSHIGVFLFFFPMNDSVARVAAAYVSIEKNKKRTVLMDLSESISRKQKPRFQPATKNIERGKMVELEAWIDGIHVTKKMFVPAKKTKFQRMKAMVKR